MDGISNLADELLCHIISFLPTKYAGYTSILSTRWRYLFVSIPNVEFVFESEQRTSIAFTSFVDTMLLLRKRQSIDKFGLSLSNSIDPFRVDGWIRAVLYRSVAELVLSSLNMNIGLPANLFTCKTLVVLKLCMLNYLRVPAAAYLPRVKVFHMEFCSLKDDDFGEFLSIRCLVIEELVVHSHFLGLQCNLNVSSGSLKRLTIEARSSGMLKIIIYAPSVYLEYSGFEPNSVASIRAPSVTEAQIDYDQPDSYRSKYHTNPTCLMKGIRNIQSLYISGGTIHGFLRNQFLSLIP